MHKCLDLLKDNSASHNSILWDILEMMPCIQILYIYSVGTQWKHFNIYYCICPFYDNNFIQKYQILGFHNTECHKLHIKNKIWNKLYNRLVKNKIRKVSCIDEFNARMLTTKPLYATNEHSSQNHHHQPLDLL